MSNEMPVDNTSDRNGTSFTNKEMWVRVDGKLDAIMAKQGHYDIELALLKERMVTLERNKDLTIEAANENRRQLADALEKRNEFVDKQFEKYEKNFNLIFKRLAAATGAVIAASGIINILTAAWHNGFFH